MPHSRTGFASVVVLLLLLVILVNGASTVFAART